MILLITLLSNKSSLSPKITVFLIKSFSPLFISRYVKQTGGQGSSVSQTINTTPHLPSSQYNLPPDSLFNKYFKLSLLILLLPLLLFILKYPLYNTFFMIIIWHILITLPLLYLISFKNKWDKKDNMQFQHPYFIFTTATGIIYPLCWGLFLSLSRYIRLGSTVNLFSYIEIWRDYFILSIFLFPLILIWGRLLILFLLTIRKILWKYTESFIFTIHLWALQYYDYFFVCKVLHKIHFVIYDFIFQYPGAYYRVFNESDSLPLVIRFTKIFHFLRKNIQVLHLSIVLLIVLEILLFKGNLYYSVYLIFIYPLSLSLIMLFHNIGSQNLILNMCLSDYLNQNFITPRYYQKFWFFSKNPKIWYGMQNILPLTLLKNYEKNIILEYILYTNFMRFHTKLPYYVHGYKRNKSYNQTSSKIYGIKKGSQKRLGIRIAAYYKTQYGVRWLHTTSHLL